MSIVGEFRIGEDIRIALEAVAGDAGTVTTITAALRRATPAGGSYTWAADSTPIAMQVDPIEDGWAISLPAAETGEMEPGYYGIDARLVVAAGVDITKTTAHILLSRAAL